MQPVSVQAWLAVKSITIGQESVSLFNRRKKIK